MIDIFKLHGALLVNVSAVLVAGMVLLMLFGSAEAGQHTGRIYKAVKFGMIGGDQSLVEKFTLLKELGYDGVEMSSPGGADKQAAAAASRETGLPIHGMVGSIHWHTRLSDPDPQVRAKATAGLRTAIIETHRVGGTAVLLVPGQVNDAENENHEQVWQRSIVEIRKVLPLASRLGIHVLVETVWNGFCHDPHQLAAYIDEIDSPWVGVYLDIGNVRKFGKSEDWIRILGRRIVKLDVKDWGKKQGFCKIGDGDVDWPQVRKALKDIRFTGWATAEVAGGDRKRIKEIAERMNRALDL
jgi:L-ribulose-5-phosphate 3-epimerase